MRKVLAGKRLLLKPTAATVPKNVARMVAKKRNDNTVLDRELPDIGFFTDKEVLVPTHAKPRHRVGEVGFRIE
jgi:hypothetical protein